MNIKLFTWKLGKGFFSGLSGSVTTLSLTEGDPHKYWLALAGAAIAALIHGGANAFDQLKPRGG